MLPQASNTAMNWSLVAARVVVESAAGARRLHVSEQVSIPVRENVPADFKISHYSNIKVLSHGPWQVVTRSRCVNIIIQQVYMQ